MNKKKLHLSIALSLLLLLLLTSCTKEIAHPICNKPYILVGNDCCIDKDDNNICDKDDGNPTTPKEPPLRSVADADLKEQAILEAQKFARAVEKSDYGAIYDLVDPQLKKQVNKDSFIAIRKYFDGSDPVLVMRLDSVELETNNKAYAYYSAASGLIDSKIPAVEMIFVNEKWYLKVNTQYFDYDSLFNKCNTGACTAFVITQIGTLEWCERLLTDDYRNSFENLETCYKGFSSVFTKQEAVKFCSENNLCRRAIASKYQDLQICDAIGEYEQFCYGDVAAETGNFSSCEHFSETSERDSCYITAARKSRQKNVCSFIKSDSMKESCKKDSVF